MHYEIVKYIHMAFVNCMYEKAVTNKFQSYCFGDKYVLAEERRKRKLFS